MECTNLTHLYIKKVFIQRDYRKGTKIRFETTMPSELENYISQAEFARFIESLNDIYFDAEKLKFCEGCMACLTAYLLYCCIETHKQKCMRKAAEFIENQNEIWKDRGVTVFDPMTRGFRILEIQVQSNSRPQ
uniref:Ras modification protein ERF4 n=1 Tax=Aceria tosichella TaxID=561515 RepID=A0A6G1S9A3_9ACAR